MSTFATKLGLRPFHPPPTAMTGPLRIKAVSGVPVTSGAPFMPTLRPAMLQKPPTLLTLNAGLWNRRRGHDTGKVAPGETRFPRLETITHHNSPIIGSVHQMVASARGGGDTGAATTEQAQDKIKEAALNLARFVKQGSFQGIVISGRSSSLIVMPLFITAWKKLFPETPLPNIFVFDDEGNRLLYKDIGSQGRNRVQLVWEYIDSRLPELNTEKSNRLCYVDDYIATGEKWLALRGMFNTLGFTRMTFAFLAGDPREGVFVAEDDPDAAALLSRLAKNAGEHIRSVVEEINKLLIGIVLPAEIATIFETQNFSAPNEEYSCTTDYFRSSRDAAQRLDKIANGQRHYPRLEALLDTLLRDRTNPIIVERGTGNIGDLAVSISRRFPIHVIDPRINEPQKIFEAIPQNNRKNIHLSGDIEDPKVPADLTFWIHPTAPLAFPNKVMDTNFLGSGVAAGGYLVVQTEGGHGHHYRETPGWTMIYEGRGAIAPSLFINSSTTVFILQRTP